MLLSLDTYWEPNQSQDAGLIMMKSRKVLDKSKRTPETTEQPIEDDEDFSGIRAAQPNEPRMERKSQESEDYELALKPAAQKSEE